MADFTTIFILKLQVKELVTVTVLKHQQFKTLPFKKLPLNVGLLGTVAFELSSLAGSLGREGRGFLLLHPRGSALTRTGLLFLCLY